MRPYGPLLIKEFLVKDTDSSTHYGKNDQAQLAEQLRSDQTQQKVENVEYGAVENVPPRSTRKDLPMSNLKGKRRTIRVLNK